MKFAICNEMYGDWPFERVCEHAKSFGYKGIEIAPFTLANQISEISESDRAELRQTATDYGLEIVGLHWLLAKTTGLCLTSDNRKIQKATAAYLIELAQLCKDLGGEVMVFGSPQQRNFEPPMTYQQAADNASEVLKRVAESLEESCVRLLLEPLGPEEGNFMLTAASAIDIVREIDSRFVNLHLDVKAMSTESKPIPDIISESREWLEHFHANDPNRRGPGMGDVDFEPIFKALQSIEYNGWVSVEPFDYDPGVDALAEESIRYMKQIEARINETL